jgi:hypothetical protein
MTRTGGRKLDIAKRFGFNLKPGEWPWLRVILR